MRSRLLLRQLGDQDGWFVIAAVNDNATITAPEAQAEVPAGTVTVEGRARGFEATVVVSGLVPGTAEPLDQVVTQGGALETPEPYTAELDLSRRRSCGRRRAARPWRDRPRRGPGGVQCRPDHDHGLSRPADILGPPMTYVVVTIHVIASSLLLILVLLHSGKGGGLSDMFGGGMGAAAQGSTVVEKNLDRITVMAALVFSFTTIGLGMLLST